MAEEKKKRWRPSLTAYREQEETIHRQCVELDAWREKYHKLLESKGIPDDLVSKEEYGEIMEILKKEEELRKLTEKNLNELREDYDAVCAENLSLKSRGFWARVFNK